MPPLGLVIGGIDFSHFELVLRDAHDQTPAVTLKYGLFVQNCIDFLIIAAAVFAIVKLINRLRRQQEHEAAKPPPEPPKQEQLLTEIRDILKAKAQ
jgi:large conductance mechanosensitive channel